jgi:hypothetical protein
VAINPIGKKIQKAVAVETLHESQSILYNAKKRLHGELSFFRLNNCGEVSSIKMG